MGGGGGVVVTSIDRNGIIRVSDFEQSKRFYAEALSPLGYELLMEPSVSAAGFGRFGKPEFWIVPR